MIKEIRKPSKVAVCHECGGTGMIQRQGGDPMLCSQCEGSGRVVVISYSRFDIRPYRVKSVKTIRIV